MGLSERPFLMLPCLLPSGFADPTLSSQLFITLKKHFRHSPISPASLGGPCCVKGAAVCLYCGPHWPRARAEGTSEGGSPQRHCLAFTFPHQLCTPTSCLESTAVSLQSKLCSATPPKLDSAAKWCFRLSAKCSGNSHPKAICLGGSWLWP